MVVVVGPASSSAAARKRQHIILKSVFLIVIIAIFIGFQLGVPLPPPPQFLLSDPRTNFSKSLKGKIMVYSARTECTNISANFLWEELRNPCKGMGYSQGAQDCQLDQIFYNIGTTNKYFVEYGFNTNTQCSGSGPNSCKLWKVHKWTGLLLDGVNENPEINLHAHYLYSTNAASILMQYTVPKELDFLSGDMDSHDYFVMDNILSHFHPRVVTTEYNANWPKDINLSQIDPQLSLSNYTWKFEGCIFGVSASALKYLMKGYGYELIGVVPGLDLIWGRKVRSI